MIKLFLMEKISWILFFIFLQLLILSVNYLDPTIPLQSTLYIVFLSIIVFIIFLIVRYHKETKFYRSLLEWGNDLDITAISIAGSPFEKIVEASITGQTEQLKQDNAKRLDALEGEKDELLSWIHEVKTPLTAMQLMIDRLDDEPLKAQLKHEWLRLHLLLDQQLHQKRIPSIENDLYIEKLKIKDILVREIKTLQSWCIQKGIGFDLDLEEEEVLSDAKWLSYIIRQILTNAVKYSQETDIIIKSYTEEDFITLEIKDFGSGIDTKDLPRIFDKGFTSTTKHYDNKATGMGLYLAKKAATPLLIHISVQSKLGEGTTVLLKFPKRNELLRITGM
jgi:two-component system, OmpR family, bacitracin resistance sensor histidine kinase BceS